MFSITIRRMAQPAKDGVFSKLPPIAASNIYKAKTVWPPDFKQLTHQQQLRFEKKYKRRMFLANRSPRWDKAVKYAQLATMTAAMIYLLFFSEFEWWGQKYKPSEELRKKTENLFGILDKDKRYEQSDDMIQGMHPSQSEAEKSKPN